MINLVYNAPLSQIILLYYSHGMIGQMAAYGGGGYVVNLGQSENETLRILQQYKEQAWIDRG